MKIRKAVKRRESPTVRHGVPIHIWGLTCYRGTGGKLIVRRFTSEQHFHDTYPSGLPENVTFYKID